MTENAPKLASLTGRIQPSEISDVFSLAVRLKEEGRDIVDFSVGEPDFDTREHVREAAKRAIDAGETRYTSVFGSTAMRAAASRKFARDNGLEYPPEQIIVGNGAKPLLHLALQATIDPGDEVIIAAPYWPSHPGAVEVVGGVPVIVDTGIENGFKMTPDGLAAAITERTRYVILCSPNNPTGAGYTAAELQGLADVLLAYPDIWILSDDLYEHIAFDGFEMTAIARLVPELYERTITVNGVSKCYAMTGWRIGFLGAPKRAVDAMGVILTQTSGGNSSISQAAAVAAIDGPQDFLSEWAAIYQGRRDLALDGIGGIDGLRSAKPEGAFYLFPECSSVIGKRAPDGGVIAGSADFARYLLKEWGVAVVPGAAFGAEPYFRLSYAVAEDRIGEGVERIGRACRALMS